MGVCDFRKYARQLLILGIGLVAPGPLTFAADGAFDGSYAGTTRVTFGTAPECGTDTETTVTVRAATIQQEFGAFPLKMEIAQNGTFAGRARKGNHGGGQGLRVRGRINHNDLEADLIVNGVHGRVCSYHWSLKKSA